MQGEMVPAGNAYLTRPDDGSFPHVTESDVKTMIGSAPDREKQLLFKLLWGTGARISELLAVTPDDWDFEEGTVRIHRLKRKEPFAQQLPLDVELVNEVRLFVQEREIPPGNPIIDVHRSTAYRWCQRIGKQALGREDVAPHHFRHGRVYAMLQDGVHPLVISRALGHASVSSVLSYVHPSEDDLREALAS